MSRNARRTFPNNGIRSLEDLQARKKRLTRQISRHEQIIRGDYQEFVNTLTLRNLLTTIAEELIATNLLVQQAYLILKPVIMRLLGKRKSGDRPNRKLKFNQKDAANLSGKSETA